MSPSEGDHRSWEDARRFGFVSGGQGPWYSQTLEMLQPGHRVFVYVPKRGYVGVGTVREPAMRVRDFLVEDEGRRVPILEVPTLRNQMMATNAEDPDKSEYLVRVEWEKTVPIEEALVPRACFRIRTPCARWEASGISRAAESSKPLDY